MTLQKIKLISNTKNRFNESTKRNRLKILNVPGFVRLPHEIIPLECTTNYQLRIHPWNFLTSLVKNHTSNNNPSQLNNCMIECSTNWFSSQFTKVIFDIIKISSKLSTQIPILAQKNCPLIGSNVGKTPTLISCFGHVWTIHDCTYKLKVVIIFIWLINQLKKGS